MKVLTDCFSVAHSTVTVLQALAMGSFLLLILGMDALTRAPGFLYNLALK